MSQDTHPISLPFRNDPARVLVLCCADGRYIDAVEVFLADLGEPWHDLVAFPGGPAHLNAFSSLLLEHQAIRDAVDFMLRAHRSKLLVLIAHHDCAYYKKRYGRCDFDRQVQDMKAAAEEVRARHPDLAIALYYLTPMGQQIGAKRIDEEPSPFA